MKINLVGILVLLSFSSFSQKKKMNYGFQIGLIAGHSTVAESKISSFNKVSIKNAIGFELGCGAYYLLNKNIELRLAPLTAFESDKLRYTRQGADELIHLRNAYVKFPFHILFSLHRKNPLNGVFGVTGSLASKPQEEIRNKLNFRTKGLTIDLGLNYEIAFSFMRILPEIKYSKSLTNVANDKTTEYGLAIDRFYRNRFTLTVYVTGRYHFEPSDLSRNR